MKHEVGDHVARQIMLKTIEEDAVVLGQMSNKKPGGRNQVLNKFDWIIAKYRRSITLGFLENGKDVPTT